MRLKQLMFICTALLAGCASDSDPAASSDAATTYVDASPAPIECPDPQQDGPNAITVEDIQIPDARRDGVLEARLIYPTELAGPMPFVVLSHGVFMEPAVYDDLAQRLASHGMVVLGTRHRDAGVYAVEGIGAACEEIPVAEQLPRLSEMLIGLFETNHVHGRVNDFTTLIDYAETLNADGTLQGRIDLDRIGGVGHSFGGLTSLLVGGGRIDADAVGAACANGPSLADAVGGRLSKFIMCAVLGKTDSANLVGDAAAFRDPRLKAVAALAPPLTAIWGPDLAGLSAIEVPTLLVFTDTDSAVPFEQVPPAFAALGASKYLLKETGGTHNNFGRIDASKFEADAAQLPEDCKYKSFYAQLSAGPTDPPALPLETQLQQTNTAVTAFALRHFAQIEACDATLTPEYFQGVEGEGLTFEGE